jgi:glycosyltransferase involved in cell wall biosynthesis
MPKPNPRWVFISFCVIRPNAAVGRGRSVDMTRVFHSFPEWQLSGVNTWSANLIRQSLDDQEFEHSFLFTGIPQRPQPDFDTLGLPHSFLEVDPARRRKDEWSALKLFLETNAPCVYIPQYDFHRSAAVPTLSPDVKVCAVIHSDEECYYDMVKRIGYSCDAIVTVSSYLAGKVSEKFPILASRVQFIPPGVPALHAKAIRSESGRLELAYCNRLAQYQKRIFDLPEVMAQLSRLGVDCHLTVTGDGPDAGELRERFRRAGVAGSVKMTGRISDQDLADVLARAHAFLLVSDFEGLPSSMLEAMSVGCVPVVYDIQSGVRDAVEHDANGYLVPHGDAVAMAGVVASVNADRSRLEATAQECIRRHRRQFSLESMASAYRAVFQRILDQSNTHVRRDGRIRVPKNLTFLYRLKRSLLRHLRREP